MDQKPSINQLLIETGAASGETAGILDVTYLRKAHQRRQRLVEAAGSASLDGRPTTPERLYAWLADIPIQGQANLGAEGYAAEVFGALLESGVPSDMAREAGDLAASAEARAGRDPLAAAAVLFRPRDGVTPASRVAYSLYLRRTLGPADLALSPLLGGVEAAARRSGAAFDAYMADRLARAARRSLSRARTLRTAIGTVYSVLGSTRSSSHVHAIAELLYAGRPLGVSSASRIFRISQVSARDHLLRLVRDGLAEPATRRKSGKIYVARDGLMTFGQASPSPAPKVETGRLAVSTGSPLSAEERERLDEVSGEVASQIDDMDRLLRRLTNKPDKPAISGA